MPSSPYRSCGAGTMWIDVECRDMDQRVAHRKAKIRISPPAGNIHTARRPSLYSTPQAAWQCGCWLQIPAPTGATDLHDAARCVAHGAVVVGVQVFQRLRGRVGRRVCSFSGCGAVGGICLPGKSVQGAAPPPPHNRQPTPKCNVSMRATPPHLHEAARHVAGLSGLHRRVHQALAPRHGVEEELGGGQACASQVGGLNGCLLA